MPTDNPKISLYVPQQVYNRFKSFQEERKLSMSQAGIVILAEYFGLKETIKEITEGTTVGGVSLSEFEELKHRIERIEKIVEQDKSTSKLPNNKENEAQFELFANPDPTKISVPTKILALRFDLKPNSISTSKSKRSTEKFYEWSKVKDPDRVGWIPETKHTYTIKDSVPDELLSRLQKWIQENS